MNDFEFACKLYPEAVRQKDDNGWLPLHFAANMKLSREIINFWLERNPQALQGKNGDGRIPLHSACMKGAYVEVIESLIEQYQKGCGEKIMTGRLRCISLLNFCP